MDFVGRLACLVNIMIGQRIAEALTGPRVGEARAEKIKCGLGPASNMDLGSQNAIGAFTD